MPAPLLQLRRSIFFSTACLLAACSTIPVQDESFITISSPSSVRECALLLDQLQLLITSADVSDSQAIPVAGFPYLRTDRFLTSFNNSSLDQEAFSNWLDLLQEANRQGLSIELANLEPDPSIVMPSLETVNYCSDLLRQEDFSGAKAEIAMERLKKAIHVPDEYQTWKRVAGLYWLTGWGVKLGTHNLHEEIEATYRTPLVQGDRIKYIPEKMGMPSDRKDVITILKKAYNKNALKIPELDPLDRDVLFAAFAPTIVVDVQSSEDRIGMPKWQNEEHIPTVDTTAPVLYKHISYTRFQGETLVQLNYIFWFPGRPKVSSMDYLGGLMDGLTWRVTLLKSGKALAYDAIHNCGCYHLFFPTTESCTIPQQGILNESAFSPLSLEDNSLPLNLYIAHTSHYLDRVSTDELVTGIPVVEYQWQEYDALRSIPRQDGSRRSLFQSNGIVAGTQRGERFFLWPTGIPGPGEMRQWGHHATAFFGRRHFDDPDIIERSFRLKEGGVCQ